MYWELLDQLTWAFVRSYLRTHTVQHITVKVKPLKFADFLRKIPVAWGQSAAGEDADWSRASVLSYKILFPQRTSGGPLSATCQPAVHKILLSGICSPLLYAVTWLEQCAVMALQRVGNRSIMIQWHRSNLCANYQRLIKRSFKSTSKSAPIVDCGKQLR